MNTKLRRSKVLFQVIFIFLSLILISGCSDIKSKEESQWEYKVIQYSDYSVGPFYNASAIFQDDGDSGALFIDSAPPMLQEEINKLGAEGWEMVSFTGEAESVATIMIFKRAK